MFADLKFAFRQLAKKPGFTAIIVLTLALGIGSTTTVFCWLQSIWLHPLPGVADQQRMFVVTPVHGSSTWHTCSLPDVRELETQKEIFAGVIGSQVTPACIKTDNQQEWIYGQIATANFFDVLGVRPLLGRTFLAGEDQKPGGNAVLVLSETYWRRRFAADPAIIGRDVEINRHLFTVIGVVPAEFYGTMSGLRCDFWAPVSMHKVVANFGSMANRWDRWLHTQVRLQPGVTQAQAQAALAVFSQRLEKAYPGTNTHVSFRVLTFAQAPYGVQPIMLPAFLILLVVSLGVLLIVAANVANLLLARGSERQREIAIRLAVGASRVRLVRQLLVESVMLAFLGGFAGIVSTFWMVDLLITMIPPTNLPVGVAVAVDWRTLGFATALALGTGFIFGLVPAWQCTRPDLNTTLKEGGRGAGSGRSHRRLRHLLVVSEIAVSLTLLVGASLCIRSANRAQQADIGFIPDRVLLAGLRIGMNGYTEQTGKAFYQKLQEHLASVPGVEGVGLASWFPLGFERNGSRSASPEGYQAKPGEDLSVPNVIISPAYFATMKIPLIEGREFNSQDHDSAELVAIINEAMAQRYWPGQNALGRRFKDGNTFRKIVGIAKTGKYYAINEPAQPMFFTPYLQGVWDLNLSLAIRTHDDPAAFANTVRNEIHRLDPGVEVWSTLPMHDYMKAAFMAPVMASRLLTAMGVIALLLAAMGIYAVMAYAVGERMREFGLRMALGATPQSLLSLVLKNGLVLAAWGIALGLALAVAVSQLLASFLYGVSVFDPLTFIGVPLLLTAIALVAALLPARRAMLADPCVALRSE